MKETDIVTEQRSGNQEDQGEETEIAEVGVETETRMVVVLVGGMLIEEIGLDPERDECMNGDLEVETEVEVETVVALGETVFIEDLRAGQVNTYTHG